MNKRDAKWHPDATMEFVEYATQFSSNHANQAYIFIDILRSRKKIVLPKIEHNNSTIHWWSIYDATVYFKVDDKRIEVLHFGRTKTPHDRSVCENIARTRA